MMYDSEARVSFPKQGRKLVFNGIAYSHLLHTSRTVRSGTAEKASAVIFVRWSHTFGCLSVLKDPKKLAKIIHGVVCRSIMAAWQHLRPDHLYCAFKNLPVALG